MPNYDYDYASTATAPFASTKLSDMSSRSVPIVGEEHRQRIATLKRQNKLQKQQQQKPQQPLIPTPTTTAFTTSLVSSGGSVGATAGSKQHGSNATAEMQPAVTELSRMLGQPEDETFEWFTSDLVIPPFDDWVRGTVLVPREAATNPNLERAERELVLFFRSTVRADGDIPVPSLAELAAAAAAVHGNMTGGTDGCTVDDLAKRFALALMRGNLHGGRDVREEQQARGSGGGASRSYGYAELVPVTPRISRHLTGLEL
ncbi:hypothetical protein F5X99DRAFT_427520 [Biscogniauxia marginata]|nr:hypothetical protein F5X99DRAFT_427520 [Biscogniauxia marginata]